MAAKTNERGLKRICADCGIHFYDLEKRPIICPGCSEEFTGEIKIKSRRGRTVANDEPAKVETVAPKEEGELEEEDAGVEVISLDDAEPASKDAPEEDSDEVVPGDISGIEDDNDLDDLDVNDLNVSPDEAMDDEEGKDDDEVSKKD